MMTVMIANLFFFFVTYCLPGFVLNAFHGSFQVIIPASL